MFSICGNVKGKQMNIENYLAGNICSEIKVGQSGADVYNINGDMILKHVERRKLEDSLFDTYTREALFYQSKAKNAGGYLPAVLGLEISEDEIILLMKKYSCPDRSGIDEQLIRKVTNTLARVHTDSIPEFLDCDRKPAELFSESQIQEYLTGWKTVLNEHSEVFDDASLKEIAEKINGIITWHDAEEGILVHGDFHWENLLMDGHGNILICDWQSVGLGGPSGDLSFFMSRLGSDGIKLDPQFFLKCYSDAISEISGKIIDTQSIAGHIAAANVITSFAFWHQFLHGAEAERVRGIYEKMTDDFRLVEAL